MRGSLKILISGTAEDFLAVVKQPETSLERLLPCCGFHTLAHMISCVCRWNAEKGWPWSLHLPYASRTQVPHKVPRDKNCPAVIISLLSLHSQPILVHVGHWHTQLLPQSRIVSPWNLTKGGKILSKSSLVWNTVTVPDSWLQHREAGFRVVVLPYD